MFDGLSVTGKALFKSESGSSSGGAERVNEGCNTKSAPILLCCLPHCLPAFMPEISGLAALLCSSKNKGSH